MLNNKTPNKKPSVISTSSLVISSLSRNLITKKTQQKTTGFTLVELIVVIVILAILSTIAFLSFSSQSASARDSTRLSDMTNISKGLQVFSAISGRLPLPDDKIYIQASGATIGYQGYAGTNVLNIIKLSAGGKDPLDTTTYYTYSTNLTQNKFQILGFLEDGTNISLSLSPDFTKSGLGLIYAEPSSYSGRYIITKGDNIGILLDSSTWIPSQTLKSSIDVITTTGTYIAQYSNKEKLTGTGNVLYVVNSTMKTGGTKFPGCSEYNIVIGTQTWAGCNSTLGTGIEWGYKDDGTLGTISTTNGCYNYAGAEDETNCIATNPAMASSAKEKSWSNATSVVGTVDNVWGKLYTWTGATQTNNACPTGWHLPSDNEWTILENTLNGSVCTGRDANGIGWGCNGVGWASNTTKNSLNNIVQALKIPLGGNRNTDGSTFYYRGYSTALWSSSTSGSSAYLRSLYRGNAGVGRGLNSTAYGFSVRCIKD
ncbi:MAG: FISUMP domain-containing protein [Candidatus Gracilibacteria bacterium]|nr:FISUMP domain-containing protein [Candidatus Gracilibacteria bacterium]